MKTLLIISFSIISCLLDAQTNTLTEIQKISADDGYVNDRFGKSIAMTDNYIIVGADKSSNNKSLSGAAYIYSINNLEQQISLTASDTEENDFFGCSVDIYNDYAVVGAYGNSLNYQNSGAVYVFYNNLGNWEEVAKLTASDEFAELWFGYAVAIYGDYIAVTAKDDNDINTNSGAVYVFYNNEGTWEQVAKFTEADGSLTGFGKSISIYGNYILVGFPEDDENGINSGSAIVYFNNNGSWEKQTKILPDVGGENFYFGNSVKIYWNSVFIGCPNDNYYASNGGCVYLYYYYSDNWDLGEKIIWWDGLQENSNFGYSIDVHDYFLIVGSVGENSSSGSAYIFSEYLGGWFPTNKLFASDGIENDNFGSSVAISSSNAVVGINNEFPIEPNSAYFYTGYWWLSTDPISKAKLSIFPNPTNGIINVDFSDNKIQELTILDITGKQIIKKNGILQNEQIDLSSFESGIYIMRIKTDKEIFTTRIVRE